jgi:hypothetical protein
MSIQDHVPPLYARNIDLMTEMASGATTKANDEKGLGFRLVAAGMHVDTNVTGRYALRSVHRVLLLDRIHFS